MGYKAYPEYKESGIEWLEKVPIGWEVRRLKFIASHNDEALSENTDGQYELEYVDISSVDLVQGITSTESMTFEKAPSRARRIVKHGDTLVSTVRTYLKAIATINNPPDNLIASTGFAVIRAGDDLDARFLAYYLQSQGFVDAVVANSTGVSYPAINASDLVCIPATYPPLREEQEKIANILDHKTTQIDRLIEKKRELIAKLQEQRIAIITLAVTKGLNVHALAGTCTQEWLGNIPDHWKRNQKLNYLSTDDRNSFVNGPFGSDLLTTELVDEGVPVIYSGDVKDTGFQRKSDKYVTEEKAKQLDFCRVDGGDILLAKVGDPPGDACVYPLDQPSGIVTQDVVRIKVDKRTAEPEYLCFLLNSEYGRHLVRLVSVEATRGRFSLADLKSIRHILPPLEEQQEIVLHIQKQMKRCNRLSDLAIREIEALQEYRTALITAAVTGQIDVRDWQAPEPTEPSAQDKDVA